MNADIEPCAAWMKMEELLPSLDSALGDPDPLRSIVRLRGGGGGGGGLQSGALSALYRGIKRKRNNVSTL